jgi:sialate O-acetylesterase
VAWYQGESNLAEPGMYDELLPALIKDWRKQWKQPELPFVFAQLPNFGDINYLPAASNWAIVREAQLNSLSVPQTAMAVTIDLGEWNDIHPDNKKDVGIRMALAVRKMVYQENLVASGPLYRSHEIKNGKFIISFDHIGSGLISNDGEPLSEFAIAGADKKFFWAKAIIEDGKVIVWNDDVKDPKYVRYAWADNPDNPNLFNREGLPASPFRTGE